MGGALWLGNQLLGTAGPLEHDQEHRHPARRGPADHGQGAEGRRRHRPRAPVPGRRDDRSDAQAHQGGRVRDSGAHLHAGAARPAAVGQAGAAPPHRGRGHDDARGDRSGEEHAGALGRDHARSQGRRPAAGDLLLFARRHARRAADAHEGGDGQDAGRGLAQARRRPAAGQSSRSADPGLDRREGDGGPGRARQGGGRLHQPPAPAHEARERSDDDLRHHPGQGAVQPRADARRSAVELRRTTPT